MKIKKILHDWGVVDFVDGIDYDDFKYLTMDLDGAVFAWPDKPFFDNESDMWLSDTLGYRCIAFADQVVENFKSLLIKVGDEDEN